MVNNLLKKLLKEHKNTINIKVKAGSKKNSIDEIIDINNKKYLKISIKNKAEQGKANKNLIKFLSQELNIPQQNIIIKIGLTSSYKIVHITT